MAGETRTTNPYLRLLKQREVTPDGIAPAAIASLRTFYDDFRQPAGAQWQLRVCHGPSCRLSGSDEILQRLEQELKITVGERDAEGVFSLCSVPCLGACGNSAAMSINGHATPAPEASHVPALLKSLRTAEALPKLEPIDIPVRSLLPNGEFKLLRSVAEAPAKSSRYAVWNTIAAQTPAQIRERLRARFDSTTAQRLIVNAHAGIPGDHAERMILERDPHGAMEGAMILAHAIGASEIIVFVPSVFSAALTVVSKSAASARRVSSMNIRVVAGAGAFILADDSAAIEALDGRVPMPTVIPNTSTRVISVKDALLAKVCFEQGDFSRSMAMTLNHGFTAPGLYEVPESATLQQLIEAGGGSREFTAMHLGGPFGRVYSNSDVGMTLLDAARQIGARNFSVSLSFDAAPDVARRVAEFCALESCGKCVPCRIGSFRLLQQWNAPSSPAPTGSSAADVIEALEHASLCGLGQACGVQLRNILSGLDAKPLQA